MNNGEFLPPFSVSASLANPQWFRQLLALLVVLPLTLASGCRENPLVGGRGGAEKWPPQLGQSYPDLSVINHRGEKIKLSSLKGKVILLEPIGMSCAGCQAFAGGNQVGGFGGLTPQKGLPSIDESVKKYAWGVSLDNPQIQVVQVLFYDLALNAPTAESARLWAEHFKSDKRANWQVVVPEHDMRGDATYQMIPGFQLIDKNFNLRFESSGHKPRHDLYKELIPGIAKLLRE